MNFLDKYNLDYIQFDVPSTWPKEWISFIGNNKEYFINYLNDENRINKLKENDATMINHPFDEYLNNYPLDDKINDFLDILNNTNKEVLCYHCTRLMDFEVFYLKENGLYQCSNELIQTKISLLYYNNIIDDETYNILNGSDYFFNNCREGILCLLSGYAPIIKDEYNEFSDLFNNYGGECFYNSLEAYDRKNKTSILEILNTNSKPYVVIAVLKLKFIMEHSNNLKSSVFDYLIKPYITETYNEIKLSFEIKNIVDSIQVLDVLELDDIFKNEGIDY